MGEGERERGGMGVYVRGGVGHGRECESVRKSRGGRESVRVGDGRERVERERESEREIVGNGRGSGRGRERGMGMRVRERVGDGRECVRE